jgi:hypothetical protein
MDYDKRKLINDREHENFMKLMKDLMKRHENRVKDAEKYDALDENFMVWHIIKDAYDEGYKVAYNFFRDELWDLTDAEDHFMEEARNKI